MTAADQGTVVSVNGGRSWSDWYNQPTAQLYHVETDDRFPYWIYSGQQDSGTVGAASRSDYGSLTYRDWHPVGGEERGWDVPDPVGSARSSTAPGSAARSRAGTAGPDRCRTSRRPSRAPTARVPPGRGCAGRGSSRSRSPPKPPHAVYTGAQYLLRSLDSGASWEPISPDLSGAEPGTAGCDGEITVANARPCGFGVVFTIALSRRDDQEIWVGTDDGLVQLTRDGGKTWKNVTPKGLPVWGKVATPRPVRDGAGRRVRRRRHAPPGRLHAARVSHARLRRDLAGDRRRPSARALRDVRCAPIPYGAGCSTPARTPACRCPSTTARTGSPLQLNLPTCWVGDLDGARHGPDHRDPGPRPLGARRRLAAATDREGIPGASSSVDRCSRRRTPCACGRT